MASLQSPWTTACYTRCEGVGGELGRSWFGDVKQVIK